jgi:hypothetical protein
MISSILRKATNKLNDIQSTHGYISSKIETQKFGKLDIAEKNEKNEKNISVDRSYITDKTYCSVYVTCEDGKKLRDEIKNIIDYFNNKKIDERNNLISNLTSDMEFKLDKWKKNVSLENFDKNGNNICNEYNKLKNTFLKQFKEIDNKYANEFKSRQSIKQKNQIKCKHKLSALKNRNISGEYFDGTIIAVNILEKKIFVKYGKNEKTTKPISINNLCIGANKNATNSIHGDCEWLDKKTAVGGSKSTKKSNKNPTNLSGGSNPAPHKKYKYNGKIKLIDSSENICE